MNKVKKLLNFVFTVLIVIAVTTVNTNISEAFFQGSFPQIPQKYPDIEKIIKPKKIIGNLLVTLSSNPPVSNYYSQSLVVSLGDTVTFDADIFGIGIEESSWEWNYNPLALNCTEIISERPILQCTVVSDINSSISIKITAEMSDGSLKTTYSNSITLNVSCDYIFKNLSPLSGAAAKYGDSIEFKWNGPGCAEYPFVEHKVCFKNTLNGMEHVCLNVPNDPYVNYKKLNLEDWAILASHIVTPKNGNTFEIYWYSQSIFQNSTHALVKSSQFSKFSYTK